MSSKQIKSVWVVIDVERSAYLTHGEFGRFMRLADSLLQAEAPFPSWKVQMEQRARAACEQRKSERAILFHHDIRREMAGSAPATDEELRYLSERFNARLRNMDGALYRPDLPVPHP
eukprot:CAMPEP_0174708426 /NCGR_PEP_ID=MMETSP1094-20130205/10685_1 /TAXON_ID=156173 /ORGANISM="Chrysochromulina brevifilum, Strain UTEX LB 985" /LENGTH=116 /DNA_ID=CAMNT_0015906983 /DNA_START=67 /DNA_END=414 /DNA_ORIENTATION=+